MQSKFLMIVWACVTQFLIGSATVFAQIETIENYNALVGRDTNITYADLLKKVFPDVTIGENSDITAKSSISLNHLFGDYKDKVFKGEIKINGIKNLDAKLINDNRVLLLISAKGENQDSISAGEMSLLALFEIKPSLKLLDAADVQSDRFTDVWEKQPQIAISSKENAFVIVSSHHNSTQGYASFSLIAVAEDKIKSVFDFPVLLDSNWCANSFAETPKISALKDARKKSHYNISVEIKFVRKASGKDCEKQTKGYTRYYRSVLIWNAAQQKYDAQGRQLTELEKFNEKNF